MTPGSNYVTPRGESGMRFQRALVTGGAGFVGTAVARCVAAEGVPVRVLDPALPTEPHPGVDYRQGSILEPADLQSAFEDVDLVFHLAANPNLWAPRASDFMALNLEGTRRVLAAARAAGVRRLVHTSTESVLKAPRAGRHAPAAAKAKPQAQLEAQPEPRPIDERVDNRLEDMPGPYCRSKYLAEAAAREAAAEGLPVVIVNPTLPVGPGDTRMTPPTRMLRDFLNGRHPAYLEFCMNMADVRDVAHGHWLAALYGEVGERYILGGHNLTMSHLLEVLRGLTGRPMPTRQIPYSLALGVAHVSEWWAALTGKPPEATVTGVRIAGSPMRFDNTKARQDLGFTVRPLEDSLTDAIAWLAENGHLRDV